MFAASSVPELKTLLQCQQKSVHRIYRPLSPRLAQLRTSQRWREFASTTRRHEDYEEEQILEEERSHDGKGRRVRYKYPLGRIVGRPGRRQRQSSERLKTDAMSKPFEVIVLRDFAEPKKTKRPDVPTLLPAPTERSEISAAQIASEVSNERAEPNQVEVEESLDAMRPDSSLVEDSEYTKLSEKLYNAYNTQQLSRYLKNSLKLSSVDADSVKIIRQRPTKDETQLRMSVWKPGRTPIEQRADSTTIIKKSEIGSSKSKVVQQILRLAWNLKIASEQQQTGEIEVMLDSWQLKYLFDLSAGDAPLYESLIDAPMLRQVTEVRPYRPHNVMRISGRRADAENVTEQLERGLSHIRSGEMMLDAFEPLRSKLGSKSRHQSLFAQSDLDRVGQQTASVVVRKDKDVLMIYSSHQRRFYNARRILLSLLDLPAPGSAVMATVASETFNQQEGKRQPVWLPENAVLDLHFRYRDLELGRTAFPVIRVNGTDASLHTSIERQRSIVQPAQREDALRDARVRSLTDQLSNVEPLQKSLKPEASKRSLTTYWQDPDTVNTPPWAVHFCRILHQPATSSNSASTRSASRNRKNNANKADALKSTRDLGVLQRNIPGVNTLLSFFEPNERLRSLNKSPEPSHATPSSQFLVAHFCPSPWSGGGVESMRTLPRIELRYQFDPYATAGEFQLSLNNVSANLGEQEIRMPLPEAVVDICFSRQVRLKSDYKRIHDDLHFRRFTKTLQESAEASTGHLMGEPFLKVKLPGWLFDEKSTFVKRQKTQEVEVDYMFDRFEQVQNMLLVPNRDKGIFPGLREPIDSEVSHVLEGMRQDQSRLRYTDVDAGIIGGRRIELSLDYPVGGKSVDVSRPVQSGLGIASLLTRIGAGEVKPLSLPPGYGVDVE